MEWIGGGSVGGDWECGRWAVGRCCAVLCCRGQPGLCMQPPGLLLGARPGSFFWHQTPGRVLQPCLLTLPPLPPPPTADPPPHLQLPTRCAGDDGYSVLKMPSGEQRLVLSRCMATIGVLSNPQNKNIKLGKAGATRWSGRRPRVRGVAMNPVDHPHGGGRGKSKGKISQTPWGKPTKGYRTRNSPRTDWAIRLSRHKAART